MNDETELALEKMRRGVCPVCDRPVNRHTKNARKVCFNLCRERYGIGKKTINLDGREVDVRISPSSLSDD